MNEQLIAGLKNALNNLNDEHAVQDATLNQLLVEQTGAWAVGLWKIDGENLKQVICAFAEGFSKQVADEFQSGTVEVSLSQTQLGIVNAIVNNRPALARATEQQGDLRKSAGWLERFDARCSLSCPIYNSNGTPQAVLAVSWAELYEESDSVPQNLLAIAKQVGQA
ncbi:MAG: hypothetical protein JKY95_05395 [Planctomycetaceae bacterium]|nr:hypothetical protein [Planctomycetaceae bacterium]